MNIFYKSMYKAIINNNICVAIINKKCEYCTEKFSKLIIPNTFYHHYVKNLDCRFNYVGFHKSYFICG